MGALTSFLLAREGKPEWGRRRRLNNSITPGSRWQPTTERSMNENLEKLIERMREAGFEVKPLEEKKDE